MTAAGDALRAKYGEPQLRSDPIIVAQYLRLTGMRDYTHPRNCIVCLYPSREAAEAFAGANREIHGHHVHGPIQVPEGWVNIIYRSSWMGITWTDPTLPDDYTPPRLRRKSRPSDD